MLSQRSAARFAALLLLAGALMAPPATLRAQDSGATNDAEGDGAAPKPASLLDRLKLAKEETRVEEEAAKADVATCALLDLDGAVDEKGAAAGFGSRAGTSLRKLLFALRDLETKDDVEALVIRLNDFQGGLAQAQELHAMLLELREHKPIHVFLTGSGVAELYLASAGTTVTVPPAYGAILNGVGADMMFFKRLMGKVGVEMEVLQMGKYKSAVEQFSREGMSDPSREAYKALLDTVFEELAKGIAEGPRHVREGRAVASVARLRGRRATDGSQSGRPRRRRAGLQRPPRGRTGQGSGVRGRH
jgi:ClpP class serine protease